MSNDGNALISVSSRTLVYVSDALFLFPATAVFFFLDGGSSCSEPPASSLSASSSRGRFDVEGLVAFGFAGALGFAGAFAGAFGFGAAFDAAALTYDRLQLRFSRASRPGDHALASSWAWARSPRCRRTRWRQRRHQTLLLQTSSSCAAA
jgi:hypothetical protein